MRITEVNIPKEEAGNGLEDIKMKRLGDVVILAGKNGSGKTRILGTIFWQFGKKPTMDEITINTQQKNDNTTHKNNCETRILEIESKGVNSSLEEGAELDRLKMEVIDVTNRIKNNQNVLDWDFIKTDVSLESGRYSSVHFVPKEIELTPPDEHDKKNLHNHANSLDELGTHKLKVGTLAKIQVIQNRWFNASHPDFTTSDEERKQAEEEYNNLRNVIKVFFGEELGRDLNGDVTLFGFPIGYAKLSDGQKILLQLCVAIYSQGSKLENLILILDEPENHLHPSILIEFIETLRKTIKNGQIWIATHSIPLLAHFDPNSIWFVESGTVKHAGKIPEKVLASLLGNENSILKLQDFTNLPAQYASTLYAFECLCVPESIMTGSNDPQSKQIRETLIKLTQNSEKLRVLDYGAGKGRIVENINDYEENEREKLIKKIDYIAYDKYPYDKERCETTLSNVYSTSEKKYYNDFEALLRDHNKGSFDVVIMCNVLHEIVPEKWLELFVPDGEITKCLKENGILMLVEVIHLPKGEKAYAGGFLVLDTPQLQKLFSIPKKNNNFYDFTHPKDPRLKIHLIPKSHLERISKASIIEAVKSKSTEAKEKIIELRGKEGSYENGRLHGFWVQQFANAQLSLEELEHIPQ